MHPRRHLKSRNIAHERVRREPEPHLVVAGVRKFGTIPSKLLLERRSRDYAACLDNIGVNVHLVKSLGIENANIILVVFFGLVRSIYCRDCFIRGIAVEVERPPIHHAEARIAHHEAGRAFQCTGRKEVICGQNAEKFAFRPFDPFVVRMDMAFVLTMPNENDAAVTFRYVPSHALGLVRRMIVDDQ